MNGLGGRGLVLCGWLMSAVGAAGALPMDAATRGDVQAATRRGAEYLLAAQRDDGGWEAFGKSHPAITALVVQALAQHPDVGPMHPAVRRGMVFVLRWIQPDGGIYVPDEGMPNYHTSVALMALSAVDDPARRPVLDRARAFLKKIQWDQDEDHDRSSSWYGGQGYGKHKRPDLSNTQMMLEALHQSGLSPEDPAYRKAMVFVSRCQMLGDTNDQPFARGSTDGGFIYSPVGAGESKAGTDEVDGESRLRSYGSMTYAGFKSLLYAGAGRDDPRVRRCVDWIRRNYTLDQNPNMPGGQSKQGLFYYYHIFARAMSTWGEDVFVDAEGKPHRWRDELGAKLVALQRPDGSWANEHDRWYEGNPHLVTAYAMSALYTALGEHKPVLRLDRAREQPEVGKR